MLEAAAAIVEGQGASLIVSADTELTEFVLFSREDDEARARDEVIDLYQRLRRVAGLDAQRVRVVSLERPSRKGKFGHPKQRLDITRMNEATRVLKSESYFEWALVLA